MQRFGNLCLAILVLFHLLTQIGQAQSGKIAAQPRYRVTDLGKAAEGCSIQVDSINSHGSVVGLSSNLDDSTRLFVWSNGKKHFVDNNAELHIVPRYIDETGLVTGYVEPQRKKTISHSMTQRRAFIWNTGKIQVLNAIVFNGLDVVVNGANDAGHMIGQLLTASHKSHAFFYDGLKLIDIGENIGTDQISSASAISDNDHVVGIVKKTSVKNISAFLWNGYSFKDIPSIPNMDIIPDAINRTDQVVGNMSSAGIYSEAFIWNGLTTQLLFTNNSLYPSFAHAINDSGMVVGTRGQHAFVWQNGRYIDINDVLGGGKEWELEDAVAINNAGQIIGIARYRGEQHIYRLDPIGSIKL